MVIRPTPSPARATAAEPFVKLIPRNSAVALSQSAWTYSSRGERLSIVEFGRGFEVVAGVLVPAFTEYYSVWCY
jgi:hypothetical protein